MYKLRVRNLANTSLPHELAYQEEARETVQKALGQERHLEEQVKLYEHSALEARRAARA